jgi:hypothetical protein
MNEQSRKTNGDPCKVNAHACHLNGRDPKESQNAVNTYTTETGRTAENQPAGRTCGAAQKKYGGRLACQPFGASPRRSPSCR